MGQIAATVQSSGILSSLYAVLKIFLSHVIACGPAHFTISIERSSSPAALPSLMALSADVISSSVIWSAAGPTSSAGCTMMASSILFCSIGSTFRSSSKYSFHRLVISSSSTCRFKFLSRTVYMFPFPYYTPTSLFLSCQLQDLHLSSSNSHPFLFSSPLQHFF